MTPQVAMIVAAAENNVIGSNNRMPWHLPNELKYFRQVTLGKPVIMGRKTWESIGKPLPNRQNIVISRREQPANTDTVDWVDSLAAALDRALEMNPSVEEIMIIGGAQVYREAMPLVSRIYLTRVHADFDGDAFLELPDLDSWHHVSTTHNPQLPDESCAYSFHVYDRHALSNTLK